MDCLKFFRLAYRLVHYQGAVRAQAEKNSEEESYSYDDSSNHATTNHGHAPVFSDVKAIAGDMSEVEARSIGAPWIEYG